ncbi:MAG: arginine--tRNA ligase [Lachnospiraceae bacterium]
MKPLIDMIGTELKQAFAACGYEESFGQVTLSNRPDLCQYQCNGAMAAAKTYKKAPILIANEVVAALNKKLFSEVTAVAPGFINIKVCPYFLTLYLEDMLHEKNYGYEQGKPQKIVIDYGGPNVAKPLHIGHLRSAVIGESVKRICRFAGNEVIGDVHLGDWGLQMGLIIEELRERKPELPYFDEGFTGEYPKEAPFTISELEEIYPCASGKSKVDEAFKERAHTATAKLQEGYAPYLALWKHILHVSVEDLKRNYENLDVSFDLWLGESDAQPYIPDMIDDMVKKGYAKESMGALVVDIREDGDSKELPPCIVRKSDGAALYETTDLATIIQREKDYQPDRYIYVADKRQELHFVQVFRAAKKCGLVAPEKELYFLGFGTVNGKDGKPFKTRDGGVMRLETLISGVNEEVYKKIMSAREMPEEKARQIAKKVGLAALKYADLSNQAAKDYIFDIDRFTSFEGNTGPYILYTMVRIKSILAKYEEQSGNAGNTTKGKIAHPYHENDTREYGASEIDLMLTAAKFNDVIAHVYQEIAPHKLCQYIYDMANAFNSFYHENKIMSEENKEKQGEWIALITLVLRLLEICTDLLGFEAPERM